MRAREVNARIEAKGGIIVRQRGSHRFYRVSGSGMTASTIVSQHSGDIPVGTLKKIEDDLAPVLGKGWLR